MNIFFKRVGVERNPVRAKLIRKAEDWKWGSIWKRENGNIEQQKILNTWPIGAKKLFGLGE